VYRQLIFIILILMAMAKARAQAVNAVNIDQIRSDKGKIKWLVDLSTGGGLQNEKVSGAERTSALVATAITGGMQFTAAMTYNHVGRIGAQLENSVAMINGPRLARSDSLTLITQLRGILPTNKIDREENSFRGAASARIAALLPMQGIIFLDALKNHHEFDRTATGEANLSYRARVAGGLTYDISPKLFLSGFAFYQAGETYLGDLRTRFHFEQELSLDLGKSRGSVYLSHSNAGDALRANGLDSNIEMFNGYTSSISIGFRNLY